LDNFKAKNDETIETKQFEIQNTNTITPVDSNVYADKQNTNTLSPVESNVYADKPIVIPELAIPNQKQVKYLKREELPENRGTPE